MKRKLRFSILMLLMAVCGAANVQAENVTFTFNTDEGLAALNIAKPERGGKTELNAEYMNSQPLRTAARTVKDMNLLV